MEFLQSAMPFLTEMDHRNPRQYNRQTPNQNNNVFHNTSRRKQRRQNQKHYNRNNDSIVRQNNAAQQRQFKKTQHRVANSRLYTTHPTEPYNVDSSLPARRVVSQTRNSNGYNVPLSEKTLVQDSERITGGRVLPVGRQRNKFLHRHPSVVSARNAEHQILENSSLNWTQDTRPYQTDNFPQQKEHSPMVQSQQHMSTSTLNGPTQFSDENSSDTESTVNLHDAHTSVPIDEAAEITERSNREAFLKKETDRLHEANVLKESLKRKAQERERKVNEARADSSFEEMQQSILQPSVIQEPTNIVRVDTILANAHYKPILPYERAALQHRANRGEELFQASRNGLKTNAIFPSGHLKSLLFLASIDGLGRSVAIKFKPETREKLIQKREQHEKAIREAFPVAISRIMNDLTVLVEKKGYVSHLQPSDIFKLRALKSIAPLLCRLNKSVFVSKVGECRAANYESTELTLEETYILPPSPFSKLVFPYENDIFAF